MTAHRCGPTARQLLAGEANCGDKHGSFNDHRPGYRYGVLARTR